MDQLILVATDGRSCDSAIVDLNTFEDVKSDKSETKFTFLLKEYGIPGTCNRTTGYISIATADLHLLGFYLATQEMNIIT